MMRAPCDVKSKWLHFNSKLSSLNQLSVPRFVLTSQSSAIELRGFCDVSQNAYGACKYVRTIQGSKGINVHLLTAKGKVALLKVQSIPRLELCGALLLAELMNKVITSVTFHAKSYFWTDSQVTLNWIKNQSKLFQSFVANRISKIQDLSDANQWNYVNTQQNPADLISRGIQPSDLVNSELWWRSPVWLSKPREIWDTMGCENIAAESLPEIKKSIQVCVAVDNQHSIFDKFPSLIKLKRIIAWVFKFANNALTKSKKLTGPITIFELEKSFLSLVKRSRIIFLN